MRISSVAACTLFCLLWNACSVDAGTVKSRPHIKFSANQHATSTAWTVPNLCHAYNFPTHLTSSGVIGILELGGGWLQSDLDAYSRLNGMPKINVVNVSIDGAVNTPGVDLNADGEVTLDIECAAAAYYYSTGAMPTIYVFFAPNADASFVKTINAAVNAKCDVLSISWGNDEKTWQSVAPGAAAQIEAAAIAASASGLTIFAAAGDDSSSDGDTGTNVDVPASCPHIIGCGGTTKLTSSEKVWGDGVALDSGTGGGYSTLFPVQSFQIGVPKPASTSLGRMVPDISANADPNTGYVMVLKGSQVIIGGTSAVAPLYSGLFAAIGKKLGFITPLLWASQTAFVDITAGSNGAYSAATGPDPCTGIGVSNGTLVYNVIHKSSQVASNVVASISSGVLTLTGDAKANSLQITVQGNLLRIEGANGTTINGTSLLIGLISGQIAINGNLGDGDDAISFVGINASTVNLQLGAGADKAAFTLCRIQTLNIDGGAGTDVLLTVTSSIRNLHETSIP